MGPGPRKSSSLRLSSSYSSPWTKQKRQGDMQAQTRTTGVFYEGCSGHEEERLESRKGGKETSRGATAPCWRAMEGREGLGRVTMAGKEGAISEKFKRKIRTCIFY